MKVVLHIGTEKTGTTSIQAFLRMNRAALAKYGLFVTAGIIGNYNNMELVLAASSEPGNDLLNLRPIAFDVFRSKTTSDIRHQIAERADQDCRLLYSSEHFSSRLNTPEDVRNVRSLFPDSTQYELVVYLRPQSQLYLGTMAEAMKAGARFEAFPHLSRVLQQRRYGASYYDYQFLLDLWHRAFPQAKLTVRSFEPSSLHTGDVVGDFARVLGLGDVNLESPGLSNPTLSPEALINLDTLSADFPDLNRTQLIHSLEAIDPYPKGSLVESGELSEFFDVFSRSNATIASTYQSKNHLFSDEPEPLRYFDPSDDKAVRRAKDCLVKLLRETGYAAFPQL